MLTAIGFCPQPPLLVPDLAAGAAAELDGLRAACAEVVRRVLASGPDRVVVLGAGATGGYRPGTTGTLAGFGVPVTATFPGAEPAVGPDRHAGPTRVPLPLTLGAWLLVRAGAAVPCSGLALGPDAAPAEVAAGLDRGRTALLVMGDGSACRSERAPGYVDPRAEAYDASIAAALRDGDAATLRDLDPALGAELLAAGVPGWAVAGHAAAGRDPAGELLHDEAPYGVGYLAAVWVLR